MTPLKSAAQPATIIIFGASGDLTRRKLVPAVHSLKCEDLLPADSQVVGVARSPLSDDAFRYRLLGGVEAYARHKPSLCKLWPAYEDRLSYVAGSYDDPETYSALSAHLARLDSQADRPG